MLPFIKVLHTKYNDGILETTDITSYFLDATINKVSEAKKNSLSINLFNNNNKLDSQNFERDKSSIAFYCSYVPVDISSDIPMMSANVDSIAYTTNNNGLSTIKLKCIDKTGLFLNKLFSIAYQESSGYTARDILINIVNHCQDNETTKITFNNVASTKHDGNAFKTGIAMAKVMKPLYEWINELSTIDNTGDDREYVYFIDNENDLHWIYPNQNTSTSLSANIDSSVTTISVFNNTSFSETGVIQIDTEQIYYTGLGTNTFTGCTRGYNNTTATSHAINADVVTQTIKIGENNVYDISIETDGDGDYNLTYFNTGKMPQGYDFLWYLLDPSDKGKAIKEKFNDWKSISLDMYNFERATTAWGNTGGSYPTPGGNPLAPDNTYTTNWGVTVESNSEFEDAWQNELKRRGENKALTFFRTGRERFVSKVSMYGNNNFYVNSPVSVSLTEQGQIKTLRVKEIRHNINKDGWVTELSFETDPDAAIV